MRTKPFRRVLAGMIAAVGITFSLLAATNTAAHADVPPTPVAAPFTAPECVGQTDFDPTQNGAPGVYSITDTTQVFGERLTSYNAGAVVPLYDAFGGTVLLDGEGALTSATENFAAYPPICGTRYVAETDSAVSEWMYCTDRFADSCGDTDPAGNIVDADGNVRPPMTNLTGNPRLTTDQEKLIVYLVQNGHSYAGVGSQAWGEVTEARSDAGTSERAALQTLVWCISDPAGPGDTTDYRATCEANMNAAEQTRLLAMIPDAPELELMLSSTHSDLEVGGTARMNVTTNIFGQPISVTLGGTATTEWEVCEGPGVLADGVLTVTGANPVESETVVLCATANTAGTATINASATPPSTEHIGWARSQTSADDTTCQVFATFNMINQVTISADGAAEFAAAPVINPDPDPGPTPGTPTEPATPAAVVKEDRLATTGAADDPSPLWIGAGLLIAGALATAVGAARAHRVAAD